MRELTNFFLDEDLEGSRESGGQHQLARARAEAHSFGGVFCFADHFRHGFKNSCTHKKCIKPLEPYRLQTSPLTCLLKLLPINRAGQVLMSRPREQVIDQLMTMKSSQGPQSAIRRVPQFISLSAVIYRDQVTTIQ